MTDQKEAAPAEQASADEATYWAEMEQEETRKQSEAQPTDQGAADEAFEGESDQSDQGADPDGTGTDKDQTTEKPAEQARDEAGKSDVWANAPPELREAYQELQRKATNLEHDLTRHRGTVSTLHRKLAQLEQSAPKQTQHQPQEQSRGQERAGDGKAPPDRQQRLKQLREEYPELAEPLIDYISELEQKVADVSGIGETVKQLQTVEQSREQAYISQQEHTLSQTHPDWQPILQQNGATFQAWIEDQPKAIREAAMRNANQIVDAQAAADVIGRFKQHLGVASSPSQQADEANPKPKLNDKRQRQMNALATPPSGRGRPVATGIPEDASPEDIWAAMDAEEARQSR